MAHKPHFRHQPPDALADDAVSLLTQVTLHLSATGEQRLQELRVDQLHRGQVQGTLALPGPMQLHALAYNLATFLRCIELP